MASDKPNILMVICHDLGTHCGCYGEGVSTPNLDALAADGVRFSEYHCTAAQCSPSRGSIMTGKYPHNNGLVGLAHIGWDYNEGEKTLPMFLRDAGYSTHLFGIQHETGGDAHRLGYDEVNRQTSKALEVADIVTEWLRGRAGSGSQQPFFASVGTVEPHRPYDAPGYQPDDPDEVELLYWLPDRPGIRLDIARLNGMVRALDEAVGRIRQALEDTGLEEDTLLIFTTDHGLAMPRAKGTCYDPGTRTTLIMRLPGRWDDGAVHGELLTNCDFLPTIMELIGGPQPEGIDGRSFLPLLDGGAYEPRENIFVEMTWHDKYNPMRGIRTNKYKYIRNFGDRPLVYLPLDVWRGPAGEEMRDEYYATRRPAEELYDLEADPLEQNNVAGEAEYQAVFEELRGRVQTWMEETHDRLLEGDWPPSPAQAEREKAGHPN